ncbi:hypothetical protein ACIQMY_20200 [Streptomyces sp. NPDC091368]|uniref:hypothetical protein n=1 Tax=Streptomyces sp. NPDC091368 TaxID=3365993 RepID=UPI003808A2AC
MATERNIRTNFGFYPPENNGAAWGATLECLERAFPEPRLKYRKSGIHGMTVLDYEVRLSPDVWVYGTAATPDPDYAYIALTDVTVDEAAAFAVLAARFVRPGTTSRALRKQLCHGERR